jgi:hypothetical protein
MWRGRVIDYQNIGEGFLLGDLLFKVSRVFTTCLYEKLRTQTTRSSREYGLDLPTQMVGGLMESQLLLSSTPIVSPFI